LHTLTLNRWKGKQVAKVITIDEFKASLIAKGITLKQWANDHGFSYTSVCAVTAKRSLCQHGQVHRIAVAMGIKANPDATDTTAV
jgi:gp16 family phage-associated protein